MKKKKTKAKGNQDHSSANSQISQRKKDGTRRKTKTRKKDAKHKKNKRENLKKKIEEEKQRLEEKKKFLNEISKLHIDSRIETTPNNLEIALIFIKGLKVPTIPFDIVETILIETDKYNKIKEIFESFEFEKKLNLLKELVNKIIFIDEAFVKDSLELDKLEENIKNFEDNLKKFNTLKNIEELKTHFETQKVLLTTIMEQIGIFHNFVEGRLDMDNAYISEEIFNELEKFYQDFYQQDYRDNY